MNKIYNISVILFVLFGFFGWREYEKYLREEYAKDNNIKVIKGFDPLAENRTELEKLAELERNKI